MLVVFWFVVCHDCVCFVVVLRLSCVVALWSIAWLLLLCYVVLSRYVLFLCVLLLRCDVSC